MSHPLISQILPLAQPLAQELGLEVVDAVFQTNQTPPVLRVDIRNLEQDTGLEDCEKMSQALNEVLDHTDLIPGAYVLEISSPGISDILSSDRDFMTFRGFPVLVRTSEPFKGQQEWIGRLIEKEQDHLKINLKGRIVSIPVGVVEIVQLHEDQS